MFIVRTDDIPTDGTAPGLLTGYGGFNAAYPVYFDRSFVEWVRLGGVLAIANIRGGGEYGKPWHEAGRRGHKQNCFDDFIAGAEHLLEHRVIAPGRLGIMGGSNGGLLVGAALTQRPDLFRAVVCSAPLLDMVRFERFILGRLWNIEYGSAEDPEEFRWLHAYSPYHHVQDGVSYPAVLFNTYESDSRVDPLHARKMCARLQAANTGSEPILLRRETEAGHAMKAISRVIADDTDTLAFLCAELGIDL
jgi:prolyl oligopeptidase